MKRSSKTFLQEEYAEDAIKLRRWDDEGKVEELSNKTVAHYLDSMNAALSAEATA